jgi:hypothetical protein
MLLTVKEMEVLCVLHSGTISATLDALRDAASKKSVPPARMPDINNLIEKLSRMNEGDIVFIAFEPEK